MKYLLFNPSSGNGQVLTGRKALVAAANEALDRFPGNQYLVAEILEVAKRDLGPIEFERIMYPYEPEV